MAPQPPDGTDATTWSLHVRYHEGRDPEVLEALVEAYLPYAEGLARRWQRGGRRIDDLRQVACEGLLLALGRFDPDRGLPFFALARPTIEGCLKRYYRDHGWTIRVPRSVHELSVHRRAAEQRLPGVLGREPTAGEVADELGVPEPVLRSARAAEQARITLSIEQPDGAEGPSASIAGATPALDDRVAELVDLRRALARLAPEERDLLRRYFGDGETQSSIAADLGVSQMQVSRLLASLLRRLRAHLAVVAA